MTEVLRKQRRNVYLSTEVLDYIRAQSKEFFGDEEHVSAIIEMIIRQQMKKEEEKDSEK